MKKQVRANECLSILFYAVITTDLRLYSFLLFIITYTLPLCMRKQFKLPFDVNHFKTYSRQTRIFKAALQKHVTTIKAVFGISLSLNLSENKCVIFYKCAEMQR